MKLSRRELDALPRESIHRARNWSKADVSVAEWPPQSGQRVVIKDLRPCPLWFRVLAGRNFLRREWRALCAMQNVAGVPNPVALPSADVIVMQHVGGQPIEKLAPEAVPGEAVRKIESLVEEMHRRGVTHGDLHGYNILVDEKGAVSLIDWATANVFGQPLRGVKKVLFDELKALDERALAKVKVMHAPKEITERERDLIVRGGSRIYRSVKKLRSGWDRLRGVDEERLAERRDF